MTLDEVRKNIDRVDNEIKALFIERMGLAEQVAMVKAENDDCIFKAEREIAIIEKHTSDVDDEIKKQYTAFLKKVMAVSRMYQYGKTLDFKNITEEKFLESVKATNDKLNLDMNVEEIKKHNRIKFSFKCQDESAALAPAMAIIGDYGINITDLDLTKIGVAGESGEKKLDYEFTFEIEANLLDKDTMAMICQLMSETDGFQVIDSFII